MYRRFFLVVLIALFAGNVMAQEKPVPVEETQEKSADAKLPDKPPVKEKAASDDAATPAADDTAKDPAGGSGGGTGGGIDTPGGIIIPGLPGAQFNIEPSTGTATMGIPIEVPPGRGGIQPALSLMYNSSSHSGIAGIGWNVEMGFISRSTKKGVPKYDATDSFAMSQGGGSEDLVNIGSNLYSPKIESGAFLKIEKNTDSWIVTDKKGTKYFFGSDAQSRQYDLDVVGRTFRWYLDRVEDVHGNVMTVQYLNNGWQLYPLRIKYNYEIASPSTYGSEVELVYEDRPDTMESYISGFRVRTMQRLKEIYVRAESVLQRRYELAYRQSASTNRSLLESVKQYGSDNVTSVPDVTMTYEQNGVKGFQEASGWTIPNGMHLGTHRSSPISIDIDLGVRIVDMDGDAYPDALRSFRSCNNAYTNVYRNTRTNGWSENSGWTHPSVNFVEICPDYYSKDLGVRFGDINADGWVDVAYYETVEGAGTYQGTLINQGGQGQQRWQLNSSWNMPPYSPSTNFPNYYMSFVLKLSSGEYLSLGSVLADINGDGRPDFVRSKEGYGPSHFSYINTGTAGWQYDAQWNTIAAPEVDFSNGATLTDLNGDGLEDIFFKDGASNSIFMNIGSNWATLSSGSVWHNLGNEQARVDTKNGSTQFADINGDGLVDVVVAKGGTVGDGSRVLINTGNGFLRDDGWILPSGNFVNLGTRLLDANADGMLDYLVFQSAGDPHLYLNIGKPSDLLLEINNGIGGRTRIEYASSAHQDNAFLPFVIPIVKSVTVGDNCSGNTCVSSYRTDYSYREGLWDGEDREFRGFGQVTVTDPDGNSAVTDFDQGDIYKGRMTQQKVLNNDGTYTITVNNWDNQDLGNGVKFVFLRRALSLLYRNNASVKATAQFFYYDEPQQTNGPQLGNLTKVVNLGDVDPAAHTDIGTDSRTIETQYLNNTTGSNHLIGLPKQTVVKDHSGNEMRKSWFWYDNNPGLNDLPTAGLLTKKEDWNNNPQGHAENPVTQYSYDATGNLRTTTDARGKVTTVTYDPVYNLFPLTTTNAMNQAVTSKYYGVNGEPLDDGNGLKGLWGQLKETRDPNNQTAKKSYDVFGRGVKDISPLDTVALPTGEGSYEYFPDYFKVIKKQRVESGQAPMIEVVEFYDGLGRLIEKKTPTENPAVFVVSGYTEYNSRGLPEYQYLPFFSNSPRDTIDPPPQNHPRSRAIYDGIGRVIESRNPDDTFSTITYGDWMTETIDENGHMQRSYFDANGRLIKKEEYLGADVRGLPMYQTVPFTLYATTEYTYDSEGNLTQTKDAHNNITTIFYDKLGRKTGMTDLDMGTWSYGYDLNGNLLWQTDARNQRIDFTYDDLNRLRNKTDGANVNVNYTYDDVNVQYSKGRLTKADYWMNSTLNNNTRFQYDRVGREEQSTKVIDTTSYDVRRRYDAMNRLKDVQYPDTKKTFYTYNGGGQIETVQFDGSGTSSATIAVDATSHSQANNVSSMTLPHTVGASGANRMLVVGISFEEGYNAQGLRPQSTQVSYAGRNLTLIGREQFTGSGMYIVGELWYLIDPPAGTNNISAQFNLSTDGVVIGGTSLTGVRQQAPEASTTNRSYSYNANVPLATLTNGAFVIDQLVVRGSTLTVTQNSNQTLLFREINAGHLVGAGSSKRVATAGNTSMNWSFSGGENWVDIAAAFAPATVPQMADIVRDVDYNAHGQIVHIEYGNGVTTDYTYDPQNLRLQRILTQASNPPAVVQDLNYTYDNIGDILTITDNMLSTPRIQSFQYDALNRLKQAAGYYCGAAASCTKTYDYNEIGNITQKDTLTYVYGENNAGPHAVTSLRNGAYVTESFAYDANGNMTSRSQGGSVTDYIYDSENRLKQVKKNNTVIAEYEYDGDGGRTKKTDFRPVNPGWYTCFLPGTKVLTVEYDVPNEEKVGSHEDGVVIPRSQSGAGLPGTNYKLVPKNIEDIKIGESVLSYDEAKMTNTAAKVTAAMQETASEYLVINNSLRVTAEHPFYSEGKWLEAGKLVVGNKLLTNSGEEIEVKTIEKVSLDSPIAVYNLEVNSAVVKGIHPAQNAGQDLSHNYYVQLSAISHQPSAKAFAESRELKAESFVLVHNKLSFAALYPGGVPVVTKYVGSLYEEESGSTNRRTNFIFLGGTRVAAATTVGTVTKVLWYHGDHLGGTNVITDSLGAKKEVIEYSPFGEFSRRDKYGSNEETAWYYFTGKPYDDETGLIYFGARYYDPRLGRFITADTVIQDPYDPQTLSRYSYTSNNPVNRIDPDGRSWWKKFWKKNGSYFGLFGGLMNAINTGDWATFGRQAAIMLATMAMNILLPGLGTVSSNFFFNVGVHILAGAAQGALIGGVSSAIMGGSFADGARIGAITGGVMGGVRGVTTSQQFGNWQEGNGFKSNQSVINKMAKDGKFQEAIDYSARKYGYQGGKYDPSNSDFSDPNVMGFTDPRTGEIRYSKSAFFDPKTNKYVPSRLQNTGFHESVHAQQVAGGQVQWGESLSGRDYIVNKFALEMDAARQTIIRAPQLNLGRTEIYQEIRYYNHNATSNGSLLWGQR